MAGLREHVEAELVEISSTLAMLPKGRSCSSFSPLELAGVAAVLQGFYNGVENILRSIARAQCRRLPEGPTSHRELLNMAQASGLLAADIVQKLGPFMQFRHFIRHSYALDIDPAKLEPLVQSVQPVFDAFRDQALQRVRDCEQ